MAKLKALEAAKELGTNAGTLLENVLRIKKNATDTLSFLRRIDDQFKSREAKRKEEERREQERIRQENQRTAFIMDAPEETVDVVANEELGIGNEEGRGDRLGRPNLPIPQASRGLAPTTDDSSLTDSTPAAEALPTADAVAAQEVPAKPVVQAAEPPAQPAAEPKPAQTPPAVQTNFPQPGRIVRVDAKPTDKPKRQRDAAPQRPPRPQGQAAVSPSDYRAAERVLPPGTHAAYPLKPGIQGKMLPPRQPQSAAPRTENKTDAPRQTFAPRPFIPAQGPRPFTPAGQTTATGLPLRSYGGQAAPAGQRPFTPGQQRPF
ncbi:MAG: hypothetical protein LBD16_04590, partial [Oscillospiraceae bacterium]|nr:hypothetical protein [Oscillospiraceae bacterium]